MSSGCEKKKNYLNSPRRNSNDFELHSSQLRDNPPSSMVLKLFHTNLLIHISLLMLTSFVSHDICMHLQSPSPPCNVLCDTLKSIYIFSECIQAEPIISRI